MYNNYFYDRVFNPNYINQSYWLEMQKQNLYQQNQDLEVLKAVKAIEDLCKAVKNMDQQHQEQAFYLCLGKMADELGWK